MEVLNEGERWTCEPAALDIPIGVWMSTQANEPCVHHQEANLPGLLPMWTRIRVLLGIDASIAVESCSQALCAP
jgi:hypothetical protein